jgi:hypothetical protein
VTAAPLVCRAFAALLRGVPNVKEPARTIVPSRTYLEPAAGGGGSLFVSADAAGAHPSR